MYMWIPQTIGWYADAVAYTGFDKKLADMLQPYLPMDESICDLGCGIGYLALELAQRGYDVTALDHNSEALKWLAEQNAAKNTSSLTISNESWDSLSPEPKWDNVIMICAGGSHDYTYYQQFCRKRLILVDRVHLKSHVIPDGRPSRFGNLSTSSAMSADGFHMRFTLEFGQPFRSMDEARAYFKQYYGPSSVNNAADALIETDSPDFPLYLPYQKDLEMLVLDKAAQQHK